MMKFVKTAVMALAMAAGTGSALADLDCDWPHPDGHGGTVKVCTATDGTNDQVCFSCDRNGNNCQSIQC